MSLLSVLVDGSDVGWGRLADKYGQEAPADLIRALVSFTNSHLSMSAANRLLMLAYGTDVEDRVIFNSRVGDSVDASYAIVQQIRKTLTKSVRLSSGNPDSLLGPTLAQAICFLKRLSTSGYSATSATNSSAGASTSSTSSRVVILSLGNEFETEHSILMNLFFSANKHGMCVDVVALGDVQSTLLQQASDITSGLYLKVDTPKGLLRVMMTHILCPFESRNLFPHPSLGSVDFRAGCVCHNKLVEQGWVCSVCLSVLCQFMPICPACSAVFKINVVPRRAKKRKTLAAE